MAHLNNQLIFGSKPLYVVGMLVANSLDKCTPGVYPLLSFQDLEMTSSRIFYQWFPWTNDDNWWFYPLGQVANLNFTDLKQIFQKVGQKQRYYSKGDVTIQRKSFTHRCKLSLKSFWFQNVSKETLFYQTPTYDLGVPWKTCRREKVYIKLYLRLSKRLAPLSYVQPCKLWSYRVAKILIGSGSIESNHDLMEKNEKSGKIMITKSLNFVFIVAHRKK